MTRIGRKAKSQTPTPSGVRFGPGALSSEGEAPAPRTALEEEIVRYLTSTWNCWWTARRIGTVLPHAAGEIERILQSCWLEGRLRRKRGPGGAYEYQVRSAEIA